MCMAQPTQTNFVTNVEGFAKMGLLPGVFALGAARKEIFENQLQNQGIVDDNTLKILGDFDRAVRQFSSKFEATPSVVLTGQSALSVKANSLTRAEKQSSNIIESGQEQKRDIVSQAKGQQKQLLGDFISGTSQLLMSAASMAAGGGGGGAGFAASAASQGGSFSG